MSRALTATTKAMMAEEAGRSGRSAPPLDATARVHLRRWPWPGNVRELRNVAAYLVAMTQGPRVRVEDLPATLLRAPPGVPSDRAVPIPQIGDVRIDLPYMEARRLWLDEFQQRYVDALLEEHGGNVSAAARVESSWRLTPCTTASTSCHAFGRLAACGSPDAADCCVA